MLIQKFQIPYKITDFEPYLSEESFNQHYNVLYDKYVKQCNNTYQELDVALAKQQEETIKFLNSQLSFMSNGYYLHTLFFENLSPNDTTFSTNIQKQWAKDFGRMDFSSAIKAVSAKVRGSGWVVLGWNTFSKRLVITSHESHNCDLLIGVEPLAVFDLWEHAYYIDYYTERDKYLTGLLKILDREIVSARFDLIKQKEETASNV